MRASGLFLGVPRGALVYWLIAPAVILLGAQGVAEEALVGFDIPAAALTRVVSPVVSAVAGCIAGKLSMEYGEKVSALLHIDDLPAVYAAAGVAGGLSIGSLIGLVLLAILFFIHRNDIAERIKSGSSVVLDGRKDFAARLRYTAVIYSLPGLLLILDAAVYHLSAMEHTGSDLGMFAGAVLSLCASIGIACVMPFQGSWRGIRVAIRKGDLSSARGRLDRLVHFAGILLFPVILWLMVLAEPVSVLSASAAAPAASGLLVFMAPVILLLALAVFIAYLIMELGRFGILLIDMLLGAATHVVVLLVLTVGEGYGLHALTAAWAAGLFIMDLAGALELCAMLGYRQEWVRCLAIPFITAAGCAVIVSLVDKLLRYSIGELLTIVVALVVAIPVYLVALVLTRSLGRYDLEHVPFGRWLIPFAQRLER